MVFETGGWGGRRGERRESGSEEMKNHVTSETTGFLVQSGD